MLPNPVAIAFALLVSLISAAPVLEDKQTIFRFGDVKAVTGLTSVDWEDAIAFPQNAVKDAYSSLSYLGGQIESIVNGTIVNLPDGINRETLIENYNKAKVIVEEFKIEHPNEALAIEIIAEAALAAAFITLAPEIAILLLRPLGWGRTGVVLRSLAASIQSSRYAGSVPAKSIFAWLTSAAMRGYALRHIRIVASTWTVLCALLAGLWHYLEHQVAAHVL